MNDCFYQRVHILVDYFNVIFVIIIFYCIFTIRKTVFVLTLKCHDNIF